MPYSQPMPLNDWLIYRCCFFCFRSWSALSYLYQLFRSEESFFRFNTHVNLDQSGLLYITRSIFLLFYSSSSLCFLLGLFVFVWFCFFFFSSSSTLGVSSASVSQLYLFNFFDLFFRLIFINVWNDTHAFSLRKKKEEEESSRREKPVYEPACTVFLLLLLLMLMLLLFVCCSSGPANCVSSVWSVLWPHSFWPSACRFPSSASSGCSACSARSACSAWHCRLIAYGYMVLYCIAWCGVVWCGTWDI